MTSSAPTPDNLDLLTPADVARKGKVSVKTIHREIARGHLIAHKVGDQWRIFRADFASYLAARRSR